MTDNIRDDAARVATQIGGLSNHEAEASALSGCMAYRGLADEMIQFLSVDDFTREENAAIFTALSHLVTEGKLPDLVTLAEAMNRGTRSMSAVYLADVASVHPSRAMAIQHARVVKDLAARRRIATLAYRSLEEAFDRTLPTQRLLQGLVGASERVLASSDAVQSTSPAQAIPGFLSRLDDMRKGKTTLGVQTRFTLVNKMLGGIVPTNVIVVAARPGMGKTALALNIVDDISKAGVPVGVMSLEMPVDQLLGRHFASGCAIDGMKIRNGSISNEDWERICRHAKEFETRPIRYFDGSNARPSQLRVMIQRWKREMGLQVLVIDYLQLMRPDVRGQSREREISEISNTIKQAALEFGIGVILLCQLNRLADGEDIKLSHLRESGSIEQDADCVVFLHNWEHGQAVTAVNVEVAKNRHGPTGTFQLSYVNKTLRFENLNTGYGSSEPPPYPG